MDYILRSETSLDQVSACILCRYIGYTCRECSYTPTLSVFDGMVQYIYVYLLQTLRKALTRSLRFRRLRLLGVSVLSAGTLRIFTAKWIILQRALRTLSLALRVRLHGQQIIGKTTDSGHILIFIKYAFWLLIGQQFNSY